MQCNPTRPCACYMHHHWCRLISDFQILLVLQLFYNAHTKKITFWRYTKWQLFIFQSYLQKFKNITKIRKISIHFSKLLTRLHKIIRILKIIILIFKATYIIGIFDIIIIIWWEFHAVNNVKLCVVLRNSCKNCHNKLLLKCCDDP